MTSGKPGAPAHRRISGRSLYAIVGTLLAASAAVETFSTLYEGRQSGSALPVWQPLTSSATSALLTVALLPLVFRSARILWALRRQPVLALPLLALALVAFSALHVSGMVLLRQMIYAAAGRSYSLPWTWGHVLYEFRKDALSYLLLSTALILNEWPLRAGPPSGSQPAPRPAEDPAPAASPPAELWLRDGAASVRIEAQHVVWVASAGNYVEYALADGRRYLIRSTLRGEEARLETLGIVRIHRTRLVNARRVVSVTPRPSGDADLRLDTADVVVCSRRYRSRVRAALGA